MSYAIVRNEKLTRAEINGKGTHNDRKAKNHTNKDIDPTRTHLNYYIKKNELTYTKEFDKYISRYFSSKKMNQLFLKLEASIPRKHKIMLKQIKIAFESKSFALANDGLMSIIDDQLSFYIYDNISYKILQEIFNKIARDLLLLANEAVKFKH